MTEVTGDLADVQTLESISAVGHEVDPLNELGFSKDDQMRGAWNPYEQRFYIVIRQISDDTLHVFGAKDVLRNQWEKLNSAGGFSLYASQNINYPLVTQDGTLLFGAGNAIVRLPRQSDDSWGASIGNVEIDFAPLHWRHGQDRNGDIYAGGYQGTGVGTIRKSSDDGQTWMQIGDFSTLDTHIHGLAAAPRADVLGVTWGDSNKILQFVRKDGTSSNTINALGAHGGEDYQGVPIQPLYETAGVDDVVWITGSDESKQVVSRCRSQINSDATLDFDLNYAVGKPEKDMTNPYVPDMVTVGGSLVALVEQGYLSVSHDGWFWEQIKIPYTTPDPFPQTLTETGRWLVAAGDTLSVIPKDRIWKVNPTRTVYTVRDGTQSSATATADVIMNSLPTSAIKTIRGFGYDTAAWDVDIRELDAQGAGALTNTLMANTTTGGGAGNGNQTLNAGMFHVQSGGNGTSADNHFSVVVEK